MTEPIRFVCCYCHFQLAAGAERAECMIECQGCGRSVLVPPRQTTVDWPTPPPPKTSNWAAAAFVAVVMGVVGGVLGGAICFGIGYVGYLNWIGINLSHAVLAGGMGCLVGMFLFGLLGWNIGTR